MLTGPVSGKSCQLPKHMSLCLSNLASYSVSIENQVLTSKLEVDPLRRKQKGVRLIEDESMTIKEHFALSNKIQYYQICVFARINGH